jgi:hypothetical protein
MDNIINCNTFSVLPSIVNDNLKTVLFSCETEYCDLSIVSETTRCVSDDFIKTIDDQDKMLCTFMCEG